MDRPTERLFTFKNYKHNSRIDWNKDLCQVKIIHPPSHSLKWNTMRSYCGRDKFYSPRNPRFRYIPSMAPCLLEDPLLILYVFLDTGIIKKHVGLDIHHFAFNMALKMQGKDSLALSMDSIIHERHTNTPIIDKKNHPVCAQCVRYIVELIDTCTQIVETIIYNEWPCYSVCGEPNLFIKLVYMICNHNLDLAFIFSIPHTLLKLLLDANIVPTKWITGTLSIHFPEFRHMGRPANQVADLHFVEDHVLFHTVKGAHNQEDIHNCKPCKRIAEQLSSCLNQFMHKQTSLHNVCFKLLGAPAFIPEHDIIPKEFPYFPSGPIPATAEELECKLLCPSSPEAPHNCGQSHAVNMRRQQGNDMAEVIKRVQDTAVRQEEREGPPPDPLAAFDPPPIPPHVPPLPPRADPRTTVREDGPRPHEYPPGVLFPMTMSLPQEPPMGFIRREPPAGMVWALSTGCPNVPSMGFIPPELQTGMRLPMTCPHGNTMGLIPQEPPTGMRFPTYMTQPHGPHMDITPQEPPTGMVCPMSMHFPYDSAMHGPPHEPTESTDPKVAETPKKKEPEEDDSDSEESTAESSKEEEPKEAPSKEEDPKEEPHMEEEPKEEPHKEEEPKEAPSKEEDPKEEPYMEEDPKEEPHKEEEPKEEPHKEEETAKPSTSSTWAGSDNEAARFMDEMDKI